MKTSKMVNKGSGNTEQKAGAQVMNMDDLLKRIKRLEYHQSLLLKMSQASTQAFYKLIIEKSLGEEESSNSISLCEELNNRDGRNRKRKGLFIFIRF